MKTKTAVLSLTFLTLMVSAQANSDNLSLTGAAVMAAGDCSPLKDNACGDNGFCYINYKLTDILSTPQKYKCETQDDCGKNSECVILENPMGQAQVCVPNGKCIDTSIHAKFIAPAEARRDLSFDLDTKECVELLANEKSQKQKDDRASKDNTASDITDEIVTFTNDLESSDRVHNDFFGVNKQGLKFAHTFNNKKEATYKTDKQISDQLKAEYEELKTLKPGDVMSNGKVYDSATGFEVYDIMYRAYQAQATSALTNLNDYMTLHDSFEEWRQAIINPSRDYYSVGQEKGRGLAKQTGTKKVETDIVVGKDEDGKPITDKKVSNIPVYAVRTNICGVLGAPNGDCTKECKEENGYLLVDPFVAVEKKKRGIFAQIGCALKAMFTFGQSKCDDTKDVIPQNLEHYGRSLACSYISPEPADPQKSAIQSKLATLDKMTVRIEELVSYYESIYREKTKLAECTNLVSGYMSDQYKGQNSKYTDDTSEDTTKETDKTVGGKIGITGDYNVAGNLSNSALAFAAYQAKLKGEYEKLGMSQGEIADLLAGSDNSKNALSKRVTRFQNETANRRKQSQNLVDLARKSGQNSPYLVAASNYNSFSRSIDNPLGSNSRARFADGLGTQGGSIGGDGANLQDGSSSSSMSSLGLGNSGTSGGTLGAAGANGKGALAANANAKNAAEAEKARKLSKSGSKATSGGAGHNGADLVNPTDSSKEDEGKKKIAKDGEEEATGEEVAKAEDAPLPPNFDEYDLAAMLSDVQSDQYKYSRRSNDSLWDIITKTYMRSAIKTFYGDRAAAKNQE